MLVSVFSSLFLVASKHCFNSSKDISSGGRSVNEGSKPASLSAFEICGGIGTIGSVNASPSEYETNEHLEDEDEEGVGDGLAIIFIVIETNLERK